MIQIQLLITKVIGKMYKSTKVKVTQIFSARIYIDLVICDEHVEHVGHSRTIRQVHNTVPPQIFFKICIWGNLVPK